MPPSNAKTARVTFTFVATLYIAWIAAWLLAKSLESRLGCVSTSGARTRYWIAMKALLWIGPSTWLIRYCGLSVRRVVFGGSARLALSWGLTAGMLIGLQALAQKWLSHGTLSLNPSWAFFNGVVVAPIVEEFTFRGAVLNGLTAKYRFPLANTATAFLFVGSHLPGWYFQNTLRHNMLNPLGGALSIFVLGWVFGYVVHKSQSVFAGIVAHTLNNFFSQL